MGILLHTMATPEMTPEEAIRLASRLGFDGVELICQADYRCGVSPVESEHAVRALGVAAAGLGVPVAVLSSYEKRFAVPGTATRMQAIDGVRRELDLAAALGAGQIRLLAAEEVEAAAWEAALDRFRASLTLIADHAAERGIEILIENHMDTMATSAARTVAACGSIERKNVGILYDPANLATIGAEDFHDSFELQKTLIRHVHVKDAVLENEKRKSVVPGEGSDPWPETIRALYADGYRGHYSLEYERRWLAHLPPAEVALPAGKNFLEQCLDDARAEDAGSLARA
ncbi:sugar phosphate isomerase/epimerase [Mesorhizobium sp. AD1-1]|uniref:sugar phosphate isomerase/epimerase family protein n=1 Tax=Mesorhizobium sp. AD1-1 TaxID=2876621 RepID=UPI001CCA040E|nr:sugar phosphate isomerase/epimerase family protein [Mesorhizobium sp. AD1-1]MBZ9719239.1 sugar phosphate isomerase/epimerase [Mesorhizobium sp. AD1-1]